MAKYYLRNNIKAEPTINSWYAWALLVSPVTLSMLSSGHHVKLLESYIEMPEMHVQAVSEPAMLGGPFIDTQGQNKSTDIKELLKFTYSKLDKQHQLAESIRILASQLEKMADGGTLEILYLKLSPLLSGYVEFFYDLLNHANFRLIEPFFYASDFYQVELQKVLISPINSDDRPFALSTPLISSEHHFIVDQPFYADVYDRLFSARTIPLSRKEITDLANQYFATENHEQFFELFSEDEPIRKSVPYNGQDIRIRYFGHACLLIETSSVAILIDPLVSYDYYTNDTRFSLQDLPDIIDYVLITHAHQDHFVIETLLQIRHKVKNIIVPQNNKACLADPSLKLICQQLGFKNVITLDEMESIALPEGEIIGIPFLGEHGDLNIFTKLAYIVNLDKKYILCSADSNNFDNKLYQHIQKQIPEIDVMFIGMECDGAPFSWLYGSLLLKKVSHQMDKSRRLNGSDSKKAQLLIETFSCPEIYVYAMGQEPWLKFISSIKYTEDSQPIIESNCLLKYCTNNGIKAERLFGSKEIVLSK